MPHYLINEDFRGSAVVANVFRILAALILIRGAISATVTGHDMHQNGYSNTEVTEAVIGIVAGTIVSASAMLFFTFVLELLRAIHFDLRHEDAVKANSAASSPNGAPNHRVGIQAPATTARSAGGTVSDGQPKPWRGRQQANNERGWRKGGGYHLTPYMKGRGRSRDLSFMSW